PAIVGGHVYANGKRGVGYLLDSAHFGGVGGNTSQVKTCPSFGAASVNGDVIYVPCGAGTTAGKVNRDGSMTVMWHTSAGTDGSPMLGGGVLWAVNTGSGTLVGLDPATGNERTHVDLGAVPHFATPTLARGTIYVGTMSGVTALR